MRINMSFQKVQFRLLRREFSNRKFALLDVGCGNHSVREYRKAFRNIEYYGLDAVDNYNNYPEDIRLMRKFFLCDLNSPELQEVPNYFFDAIVMSHIIEHLTNVDRVLSGLSSKLKRGGAIYIESILGFQAPFSLMPVQGS